MTGACAQYSRYTCNMRIPVHTRKLLFLNALEKTGNVSEACRCVGWARPTAYGWRKDDAVFGKAWEQAVSTAVKALEAEALRRVGERPWLRSLSDPFLERLLKLHRPNLYSKHARN